MNLTLQIFKTAIAITLKKIYLLLAFCLTLWAGFWLLEQAVPQIFAQSTATLPLAIVNHDSDPQSAMLFDLVLQNSAVTELVTPTLTTADKALQLLQTGEVTAVVTIPENFVQSLYTGDNQPLALTLGDSNLLESYIVQTLAHSFSDLLLSTQAGLATTFEIMRENGLQPADYVLAANLDYLNTLLRYSQAFHHRPLEYVSTLDLPTHYVLSFLGFIIFLSAPIFYQELNIKAQLPQLKLLKVYSKQYPLYLFCKIFLLVVIYSGVLSLLLYLLEANFTLSYALGIFCASLFIVSLSALVFNLAPDYVTAVFLNFVFHLIMLVVGGGVVPALFLPSAVNAIAPMSPSYILRQTFGMGFADFQYTPPLVCSVLLLGVLYLALTHRTKEAL